jgi:site-specific DNA recombinase
LLELTLAAKARKFNAIIVESLDRLSRDQADLAGLFKKLKFYGVDLRTLNEGKATDVQIGLRGIVGSMYLKDLGDKVRRHHFGRVREGKVMGIVTYGYRAVPGKPGQREIDPERAAIVRRIFTEYASGVSPRAIALGLTGDNIPSPNGFKEWSHQSFLGGGGKAGMLRNRLYVGELIYNKSHSIRDPETGGWSSRDNPETEHLITAVPHLRIIEQPLWDAAQEIREGRAITRAGRGGIPTRRVVGRSDRLLAGLLRCGACHGHMILSGSSRGIQFVACAAAHNRSGCAHRKAYIMNMLQQVVFDSMHAQLTAPEFIKEQARAYVLEFARLEKENSSERLTVERQRNKIMVQIDRLVAAISDSDEPLPALLASLKVKETERVGLEERIRLLGAETNVTTLHPQALAAFGKGIESLRDKLAIDVLESSPACRMAFRNVVDSIVVHPTGYRKPYEISIYCRVSAIMGGVELFPATRSNAEILQSEGVSLAAIPANPGGQVQRGNTWR